MSVPVLTGPQAAGRLVNQCAGAAFATWHSLVLYRQWKADSLAAAVQGLGCVRKRAVLALWRGRCEVCKSKREWLQKAIASMQNHSQARGCHAMQLKSRSRCTWASISVCLWGRVLTSLLVSSVIGYGIACLDALCGQQASASWHNAAGSSAVVTALAVLCARNLAALHFGAAAQQGNMRRCDWPPTASPPGISARDQIGVSTGVSIHSDLESCPNSPGDLNPYPRNDERKLNQARLYSVNERSAHPHLSQAAALASWMHFTVHQQQKKEDQRSRRKQLQGCHLRRTLTTWRQRAAEHAKLQGLFSMFLLRCLSNNHFVELGCRESPHLLWPPSSHSLASAWRPV